MNDYLLIPPPPAGGLEGDPIEEVALVRDELANLAWAIETTVPSSLGSGRPVERRSVGAGVPPSSAQRVYVPFPQFPGDRVPMTRLDREGTWLARAEVVEERSSIAQPEGRFLHPRSGSETMRSVRTDWS